jgi:hypothetical protein
MMKTIYRNVVRTVLCSGLLLGVGAFASAQTIYPGRFAPKRTA